MALLTPGQLRRSCAFPSSFADLLTGRAGIVGQERAFAALDMALAIEQPGYHVFVAGHPGSGRRSLVSRHLHRCAQTRPAAADWCYVNNFRHPMQPRVLRLPTGQAAALRDGMDTAVAEIRADLSALFASDEYVDRIAKLTEQYRTRPREHLQAVLEDARVAGLDLVEDDDGLNLVRASEEAQKLPAGIVDAFRARLQAAYVEAWRGRREEDSRRIRIGREMARPAVTQALAPLRERFAAHAAVVEHLEAVEQDILDRLDNIGDEGGPDRAYFDVCRIQILVGHADDGAPVVFEVMPNGDNLLGRIDQVVRNGILESDFTLIRPGALHRANGGFLMLEAAKVIEHADAWSGLKRALLTGSLRFDSGDRSNGQPAGAGLDPEPIPFSCKVILLGEREAWFALGEIDPDFADLFGILAEFEEDFPRDDTNERKLAALLVDLATERGLLPTKPEALAALVDEASRRAEDSARLSLEFGRLCNVLVEADYHARSKGDSDIAAAHISAALQARHERLALWQRRWLLEVDSGVVALAVEGSEVGQINALVVIDEGDFSFGHPCRVTATSRVGEGDIVDIERESDLSGPFHNKGVMILAAFFTQRYCRTRHFAVAASLAFEQSYSEIDGDSASLGELCALLSSVGGIPIDQRLAVTGSVNQKGEVQAIGGVNEKIEGFFDLCLRRGLAGGQGVIIPEANVGHLMLREEVVAAVAAGRFSIHAVRHTDQAMELLTGLCAGAIEEGKAGAETINGRVLARLEHFERIRHPPEHDHHRPRPWRRRRDDDR